MSGIDVYMRECKKFPLLTHEEEKELGRVIQGYVQYIKLVDVERTARREGVGVMTDADFEDVMRLAAPGMEARTRLVCCNTRLVVMAAKRFMSLADLDDLVSAGNFGLFRAADKYRPDHEANARFATYAMPWVRQFMRRLCHENRVVHIPMQYLEEGIQTSYGEAAQVALDAEIVPFPLDGRLDPPVYDVVQLDDPRVECEKLLELLPGRYRTVLKLRYLQGWPLDRVAAKFEVTRQRIQQMEAKAIKKLKSLLLD